MRHRYSLALSEREGWQSEESPAAEAPAGFDRVEELWRAGRETGEQQCAAGGHGDADPPGIDAGALLPEVVCEALAVEAPDDRDRGEVRMRLCVAEAIPRGVLPRPRAPQREPVVQQPARAIPHRHGAVEEGELPRLAATD